VVNSHVTDAAYLTFSTNVVTLLSYRHYINKLVSLPIISQQVSTMLITRRIIAVFLSAEPFRTHAFNCVNSGDML